MIFHRFQCEFILKHKDCDCHSKLFTSTRPTDKKHSDLYVPITKLTSMTLCPNLEWLDHLLPKSPLLPPFSNLHDLLSNSSCDPTPNLPHLYLKLHSYYGQKILGIRRSQILDLSRSEIWKQREVSEFNIEFSWYRNQEYKSRQLMPLLVAGGPLMITFINAFSQTVYVFSRKNLLSVLKTSENT